MDRTAPSSSPVDAVTIQDLRVRSIREPTHPPPAMEGVAAMSFRIHFHDDIRRSNRLHEECERICEGLRTEFPEAGKFEISLHRTGDEYETNIHVTGKDLSMAASAHRRTLKESTAEAFSRLQRQLRKRHDKQISTRRREAHRTAYASGDGG